MRRGRVFGHVVVAAIALTFSTGAWAATPGDIAADLADGKLDRSYTQAELSEFLKNATVQGYEQPTVVVTPPPTTVTTVTTTPAPVQTTPAPAGGAAGQEQVGGAAGQEQVVTAKPQPTKGVAGVSKVRRAPAQLAPARRGTLPFTGVDLALMTFGGIALVLLGAGIRRVARERA